MDIGRLSLGIVTFFLGILESLLAFRFVLKLLAANSSAEFTNMVYNTSEGFVSMFKGVFPSFQIFNFTLEISTILAMIVYGVIGLVIITLLRHFEGMKVKTPHLAPSHSAIPQTVPQQPIMQSPQYNPLQQSIQYPQQQQVPQPTQPFQQQNQQQQQWGQQPQQEPHN